MLRIGRNEDSDMLVVVSESRRLSNVPVLKANAPIKELERRYSEEWGEDCEVIPNFTFTATIVPARWAVTLSGKSASVTFVDADDPRFEYNTSHKSLFRLLEHIAAGDVKPSNGGFYGLFTFTADHGKFVIDVYRG